MCGASNGEGFDQMITVTCILNHPFRSLTRRVTYVVAFQSQGPSGDDCANAHSAGQAKHKYAVAIQNKGLMGASPTLPEQSGAYSAQGSPCVQETEKSGELGVERT